MDIIHVAYIVIALGLFFNFSNGFNDASNIVTTIVSSRSMNIRNALIMTSLLVFCGSLILLILGTAVAKTIGQGIVCIDAMTIRGIIAAIAAATAWNIITWVIGLPSSSSHAVIGGLIGAALQISGVNSIEWKNVLAIFGVILISPLLGFISAFHLTRLNFRLFRHMHPVVASSILKRLQIFSAPCLPSLMGPTMPRRPWGS